MYYSYVEIEYVVTSLSPARTDSALKLLTSRVYLRLANRPSAAILCLHLHFMCWDMVVEHQNGHCLVDADYLSRVGADLCYDPLLQNYI